MLHDVADHVEATPDAFRAAYAAELADTINAVGVERALEGTDLDRTTLEAIRDSDERAVAKLTLTEAATVLALADGTPPVQDIVVETRDHLLMGMTTAVLDVDTLAAEMDVDLTGQEVQQAVEGRTQLNLADLAAIQAVIEARKPS